jgi:glycerol-3-phosphate dehydrogenase
MSEEAASLVTEKVAPQLTALTVTARVPLAGNSRAALADSGDDELAEYGIHAPRVRACAPRLDLARLRFAIRHEMARRLADVLFVSTYWGYERRWDQASIQPVAREMADALGWTSEQLSAEVDLALRLNGGVPVE